jgi:hypothetical protein
VSEEGASEPVRHAELQKDHRHVCLHNLQVRQL